jgi:hypothetical protein
MLSSCLAKTGAALRSIVFSLRREERHRAELASCVGCKTQFRVRRYDIGSGHAMTYSNGRLLPVNAAAYKKKVTVVVPDSPDDPNHFGHLIWKGCQLLKDAEP